MTCRKQCAYLTMENTTGFCIYDDLTFEPLAQLGWQVDEIPWNTPGIRWNNYDVVVIRSTWDYQNRAGEFIRALEEIDQSRARLENPLRVVRWNMEKSYLRDLQVHGIPIVPTQWFHNFHDETLSHVHRLFQADEVIVKPIIGANADATFRLPSRLPHEAIEQVQAIFKDRPFLTQPFVQSVVEEGEYSLFYFGGEYSHAVLKRPKPGDFRVQEEHGGQIRPVEIAPDLLAAGRKVIHTIGSDLLYTRVDLVRSPAGQPWLMELELIEPSLYFPFDPDSPTRFARALDRLSHHPDHDRRLPCLFT
ncbi:MAG: hypothetical protein JW829_10190 [Pirellulales bacterium]|nr:hypothetical protein [Pirellulales bacterium]